MAKQDRKLIQVAIKSSCLSIEMKEDSGRLIVETCMVGMQFGYDTYLSGRNCMCLHAQSLYMFHDEVKVSQMKEVLMGHAGSETYVITDRAFYEQLPAEGGQLVKEEEIRFKF